MSPSIPATVSERQRRGQCSKFPFQLCTICVSKAVYFAYRQHDGGEKHDSYVKRALLRHPRVPLNMCVSLPAGVCSYDGQQSGQGLCGDEGSRREASFSQTVINCQCRDFLLGQPLTSSAEGGVQSWTSAVARPLRAWSRSAVLPHCCNWLLKSVDKRTFIAAAICRTDRPVCNMPVALSHCDGTKLEDLGWPFIDPIIRNTSVVIMTYIWTDILHLCNRCIIKTISRNLIYSNTKQTQNVSVALIFLFSVCSTVGVGDMMIHKRFLLSNIPLPFRPIT